MVKLTAEQLSFWKELLAPFARNELSTVPKRGGKGDLTYLDKRALENRLDTVCGPHGWYPEYEATNRGYKCRLHILIRLPEVAPRWLLICPGSGSRSHPGAIGKPGIC